jgi:peptidoglycan/xylan/chitin deacetylase (PgdA/CDA1 family)
MASQHEHKQRGGSWRGALGALLAGVADRARRTRGGTRGVVALAGVAVVVGLVLALALGASGGGTRGAAASSRADAASAARSRGAGSAAGRNAPSPASLLEPSGESPEIRKLIALGKPIYCAGPRGDAVALTFDDGPGVYTRLALRKLLAAGVHATFFLVGRNLTLVSGAPQQERALGMVGDHTWTHPYLPGLSLAEAEGEVVRTQAALVHASGGPVFLFRPPYGAMDSALEAMVHAHHLLEILWDVDSEDSLRGDYAEIAQKVIAGLKPGSIILMHENHGQTIRALPYIFAALQRKHLRTASVPQLLTEDPPSPAQVAGGWSACGLKISLRGSGG